MFHVKILPRSLPLFLLLLALEYTYFAELLDRRRRRGGGGGGGGCFSVSILSRLTQLLIDIDCFPSDFISFHCYSTESTMGRLKFMYFY